ncbi:putative RNA-directed DNA polymerase from transposon X-element [Trichonephila clavipes]|uniref:Putative RNA-directed DNA polymerase from transposon X-element n=1 Tax=Trichonephila clavipes TaxID=2585209 RepID=A0A8X6VQ67_TRICX|nr:putative RNA-directed DNA polymerase from transposon X-element [Trichonephila clavipes]
MKAQKVCDVRRITIRRDGQVLNTKHLILTFSTADLPQAVKIAYIRCPVRPYIPNPLRCYQCQRYGHSKNVCRGQPTCPCCGESGHDSTYCTKKEQCLNCKEARRVVLSRTPVSGKSYAGAARTSDKCIQCTVGTDNSSDSATPTNPESDSPKRPKSRRARQRDQRPTLARIPKKISRDFHRKIEEDTLTGDCSEEDEALMDIQSTSGGGANGNASPTGGVCLFTSNLYPSNIVTLHTSLQDVAVRIHIRSLVTVCCVYLPPNDVVPQVDLNQLVSQLPAPFILLGDFNGHSPLWGHDDTNSRG